jgi:hypothetical protein
MSSTVDPVRVAGLKDRVRLKMDKTGGGVWNMAHPNFTTWPQLVIWFHPCPCSWFLTLQWKRRRLIFPLSRQPSRTPRPSDSCSSFRRQIFFVYIVFSPNLCKIWQRVTSPTKAGFDQPTTAHARQRQRSKGESSFRISRWLSVLLRM